MTSSFKPARKVSLNYCRFPSNKRNPL